MRRDRFSFARAGTRLVASASLLAALGPPAVGVPGAGTEGSASTRARVCLQRDLAEPDPDALGTVAYAIRGDTQSFAVSARSLDGAAFTVFLEDAAASGVFFAVGDLLVVNATQGRWALELEAVGGPPPELGGATLADLDGRRLEVRDALDVVQLWALLPGLTAGTDVKFSGTLAAQKGAPPGASGTLKMQFKSSRGCSKFDLRAKQLDEGPVYTVWIENGTEGVLTEAGTLTDGRLKRDTKKGDPLPLGTAKASDFCGRTVEVRDGATVLLAATIQCEPTAATGLIFFDTDRDGQLEIYKRGILDTSSTRVTNLAATDDFGPAVSADGQWIVFSRSPAGGKTPSELWKIRSNGTDLNQLTNNGSDENHFPAFSPDGTKIVWSRDGDIWSMNANGSNPLQLTTGTDDDVDPCFNFDGSKIAFARHATDADVYVMDADGSNETLLQGGTANQEHPTWCRAAGFTTWIVLEDDTTGFDDIFLVDTTGGLPLAVTSDDSDDGDPVFLLDGASIYVVWERATAGGAQIAYRPFPLAGTTTITDAGNNRRPATAGSP